jgi:hypothetical protein
MSGWINAGVVLAKHVIEKTGLPVFLMGSSLSVGAAFSGIYSDDVVGGILMGSPVVPSSPSLEEVGKPWRIEGIEDLLNSLGRAARLDIGPFFNFDEDYGYAGVHAQ